MTLSVASSLRSQLSASAALYAEHVKSYGRLRTDKDRLGKQLTAKSKAKCAAQYNKLPVVRGKKVGLDSLLWDWGVKSRNRPAIWAKALEDQGEVSRAKYNSLKRSRKLDGGKEHSIFIEVHYVEKVYASRFTKVQTYKTNGKPTS